MKAIILSPINNINTPEQAKIAANSMAERMATEANEKKNVIQSALEELKNVNPELGGF